MTKISSPISIIELGSTHVNLAIYDKFILNQSLHYEKKIDYKKKENIGIDQTVLNLIKFWKKIF